MVGVKVEIARYTDTMIELGKQMGRYMEGWMDG